MSCHHSESLDDPMPEKLRLLRRGGPAVPVTCLLLEGRLTRRIGD